MDKAMIGAALLYGISLSHKDVFDISDREDVGYISNLDSLFEEPLDAVGCTLYRHGDYDTPLYTLTDLETPLFEIADAGCPVGLITKQDMKVPRGTNAALRRGLKILGLPKERARPGWFLVWYEL